MLVNHELETSSLKKTLKTDGDLLKLDRSAVSKVEGLSPQPKAYGKGHSLQVTYI